MKWPTATDSRLKRACDLIATPWVLRGHKGDTETLGIILAELRDLRRRVRILESAAAQKENK